MTRDCTTTRISRIELRDLVDATASPERQMVTIRMPALRAQDLNAVPEALGVAEGTPSTPIDVVDAGGEITRNADLAMVPRPAALFRTPEVRGDGDVTLIGVICAVSMAVCGALAWFT